jgi:cold shock CspA family protein
MRKTGTIIAWFEKRRFGFIKNDDGTDDVFFHQADLPNQQPLSKYTRITFEKVPFCGRIKATAIEVLS